MMSRPMVLAFMLLMLIITSQFEWKQQLVNDMETSPSISQKQQQILNKEEAVKEKIILSQEKNIQRLNELVHRLQEQLLQCRTISNTSNVTLTSVTANIANIDGLEEQQLLED